MSLGARRRQVTLRALGLSSFLLLVSASPAAELEVERVELNVHLDPPLQALYAQAKLTLRNRGLASLDAVELEFPRELEPRLQVRAVWDRGGELPWRQEPSEAGIPRPVLVGLRSFLDGGKKLTLVVSYDLNLKEFAGADGALRVSPEKASLPTTGWYPVPVGSDAPLPRSLRLTVRLPKEWRVSAPGKLKQIRDGTALASYELEVKPVEPGRWLFRAEANLPP